MVCRLIDGIDGEALFVIFESSSASKEQSPAGDANLASFALGSRSPGEAGDVVAKTLLLLLLKTGAFPPELKRALTDPAFGRHILGGNEYKDFHVRQEARNAPLLVGRVRAKAKEPLKHPKDRPAPGLVDFANVRPLSNPPRDWLPEAGHAAGIEFRIGTAFFRRSHCIKERLEGTMSAHDIMKGMAHRVGQEHLHLDVYTVAIDPEVHGRRRKRHIGGQSSVVRSGLTNLHAVPTRPSAFDAFVFRRSQQTQEAACPSPRRRLPRRRRKRIHPTATGWMLCAVQLNRLGLTPQIDLIGRYLDHTPWEPVY